MTQRRMNETTPDELMDSFRGRSLKSMILFTVVAHAVLLSGASLPALWTRLSGSDTSGMSEDERVEVAVREANRSLREIAERHGIKPQDLGNRFAGGAPSTPPPPGRPAPVSDTPPPGGSAPASSTPEPKSAIEKEIDKVEPGPTEPPIPQDDTEDLFN